MNQSGNRRVLLLEPNYKNKFPPIGLMKIATYFKKRGDDVVFYKGDLKEFVIRQITDECIDKLYSLDDSIEWRGRAVHISEYIRHRRREDLVKVGVEDSEIWPLLTPWLEYYKNFYHTAEYKKHPRWDWVFVTTLFTFYWDITIRTIEFAKTMAKDQSHIMVGGVLASIQPDEIEKATGIRPHVGTLHKPGDIDPDNNEVIDELELDYSILDEIDYVYPDSGAYYSYATRGCIRRCPFCAVWRIEPKYEEYLPLEKRIKRTCKLYGEQQNLLLMDNNVLASSKLPEIVNDIKSCGYTKGARYYSPNLYNIAIRNLRLRINDRAYTRKAFKQLEELAKSKVLSGKARDAIYKIREENQLLHLETCTRERLIVTYKDFAPYFDAKYKRGVGRIRYVDFNQGVDARLFTDEKARLLSEIPIRPLRIAFDDIKTENEYTEAIRLSANHGIRDFSNYLLYNFRDLPVDLYRRLKINVDLCESMDVNIYSFPMKYHPILGEHSHDRDYIGTHWNRKYIRAVQVMLNATKGKVGRGKQFFEKAFGRDEKEFMELLIMPETFLLYRLFFEHIGYTDKWRSEMKSLTDAEYNEILPIIFKNEFGDIDSLSDNKKIVNILRFYKNYRGDIADRNSELFRLKEQFDKEVKNSK